MPHPVSISAGEILLLSHKWYHRIVAHCLSATGNGALLGLERSLAQERNTGWISMKLLFFCLKQLLSHSIIEFTITVTVLHTGPTCNTVCLHLNCKTSFCIHLKLSLFLYLSLWFYSFKAGVGLSTKGCIIVNA